MSENENETEEQEQKTDSLEDLQIALESEPDPEELVEIATRAIHTAMVLDEERRALQKEVERLEGERTYFKAKATQEGNDAVNADRAHLRRAAAQALTAINGIRLGTSRGLNPYSARKKPSDATSAQALASAKRILSDAVSGIRRRKHIVADAPKAEVRQRKGRVYHREVKAGKK